MLKKLNIQTIKIAFFISIATCTGTCSTGSIVFQEIDDRSITSNVIALLIQDLKINHLNIKVITDEGEVFLIGRVSNYQEHLKAELHARSVNNVWSVINFLRVGPLPADSKLNQYDTSIQNDLLATMAKEGELPFINLTAHSFESEIFLIGRVSNQVDRQKLIELGENIPHVLKVHSFIKAGSRL